MELWSPVFTLFHALFRLTQEKEALLTPVALILVTVAAVDIARFAFKFFSVGLLRTEFITAVFKPRGKDRVSSMSYVDVFLLSTMI